MKFIFLFLLPTLIFARVHDFQTSRLKSTAGAGVGSVLLTEGSILNPAPLALFNFSTLHLQKIKGETKSLSTVNTLNEESDSLGIIYTDSKNRVKGSVAYFDQEEGNDKRKRVNISYGQSLGKRSSYGVTYRYSKDTNSEDRYAKDKYHQMLIGATHVISPQFSVGAIIIDPLGQKDIDRKVVLGAQVNFREIIALILDIGTDYEEDPSSTLNYAAAIQIKFMQDLYLRAGLFHDRKLQEKGNGLGAGWTSPKFMIEVSSKLTQPLGKIINNIAFKNRQRETSMSLTMRF